MNVSLEKAKKSKKRGTNGGENGRRSELWFITILNKSWSNSGRRTQERCRGGGGGEGEGISRKNHGQCLFRSFNIFCSCFSVRFFNALLDLFCPPLILDINKRLEKACWILYRNLNTNVSRAIWYIKHSFWSFLIIWTLSHDVQLI